LIKINFFSCQNNGHYASHSQEKNKGEGNMNTKTSAKMYLDYFTMSFEKEYSLVSYLSTITTSRSEWLLYNDASHHMEEAWDLFSILIERDSYFYAELSNDSKYAVKGEGKITFHIQSGD
jgi:hypothetical protein